MKISVARTHIGAEKSDLAIFNAKEQIAVFQGRQAMGYDKDGAPNAKTLHHLDDFSFRFYIDGACRLIEDENGSILQKSSCERNPLALSAG